MVVYLAVDGKHLLAVGREQWLSARFGVDYRQAFVSQNGRTSAVYTAPVWTAMTNLTAHAQSLLAQLGSLFPKVENRYNSTHIVIFFYWFCCLFGSVFRGRFPKGLLLHSERAPFALQNDSFCSSKIPLLHGKRTTFGKAAFFIRSENKGVPLPRKAEGTRNQKNSHYLRSAHLLVFLTPYIFSCKHSLRARICRVLPLQRVGRHAFRWSCLSVHIIYM